MGQRKMTIADLRPDCPVTELDLIVLRRYPTRNVVGKKYSGPMAAACARDRSGIVGLLLWGDDVHRIRPGLAVRLERGWCRARDGALVVSTGRHGRLRVMEPPSSH
ncbi:MAG: hypothetical protein CBD01_003325 [Euryarchaeota archaeon TMED141]|nr:MAG: hypothetical protein CBD01_003325 [Euryarchaeota archaeon TMED141]DAC11014.1 MAG TPA: hypothetical protein D7I09_01805 [Candidatus Poseidoniales archaeon]HII18074.1 hypothetical protein [Candidatus Poseidoniaceae archaeon]